MPKGTRALILGLLAALGWRATAPLEETLRRYVHWLEEQGDVVGYFTEAEASMRRRGVVRSVLAAAPSRN